jgi:hypothetical protein
MVTTRAKLIAPSLQLFEVAAAQGRMMRTDGTFAKIDKSPDGQPAGVEVTIRRRRQILALVGVTDDAWRLAVTKWVRLRLVHRCQRGVDFLFLEPLEGAAAVCPRCHVTLAHAEPVAALTENVSAAHASGPQMAATSSGDVAPPGGCSGVEEGDEEEGTGEIGIAEAIRLLQGSSEKSGSSEKWSGCEHEATLTGFTSVEEVSQ